MKVDNESAADIKLKTFWPQELGAALRRNFISTTTQGL